MERRLGAALAALLLAGVAVAGAQDRFGLEGGLGVAPPPRAARSVEVVNDGAPVLVEPKAGAERRGTVEQGTRLPLRERLRGSGCATGVWYRIGEDRYVCEEHVRPSAKEPGGDALPRMEEGELLPHSYAFVRYDATRAYAHPADSLTDQYVRAYGEGFGVVVTGRTLFQGTPFLQTEGGLWIRQESLGAVRGSDFVGVELEPGAELDHAWVLRREAPVRAAPAGRVVRRAGRREVVHVQETRGRWVKLASGGWMDDRHLGRATSAGRPEGVSGEERWIDVSVDEQTLVAWQGDRPVYATLVSTGKRRRTHRTPEGTFRIWVKLAYSDMDDLERTDVSSNYSMQEVPWVQYFEESVGLHAAFWHDGFGRRRSHGCVNLAPRDARYLFRFTRPVLPDGWYAILPAEDDPGTVVRVR